MLASLVAAPAPAEDRVAELPQYTVLRAVPPPVIDGTLDDSCWFAAPSCGPFRFPWPTEAPREQSIVKVLWDDEHLYIAHLCQDAFLVARHERHDDPVPQDDCFEIMLTPDSDRSNCYFNVEWNPLGAYVDGHRPAGPGGPRVNWDVAGMRLACSFAGTRNDHGDRDGHWAAEVAIPWTNFVESLRHVPPRPGDTMRANFNRHHHGGGFALHYSQWSPGDTRAPSFHTPQRFGTLVLSERAAPFDPPRDAP